MLLITIRLGCQLPCESLDGLSRNWDPLKGTRRLPRVDLFGSGHDKFIGIRVVGFQNSHVVFQSLVDIDGIVFLSSLFLNQISVFKKDK